MLQSYKHPFDLRPNVTHEMPIGMSLRFYITDCGLDPMHHFVIMNGGIVPQRDLDTIFPKEGDDIIVRPYIMGGNGGKQALSILVMAAVVAGSILTAGALLPASPWLAALAIGGITAAGAAIQTYLLGPSKVTQSDTATYSWNGPQTTAQQGIPIPVPKGIYINSGNVIESYIESINNQQFLNALVCMGIGPARAVHTIKINGEDIANFSNATFDVRLGHNVQTFCKDFQRLVNTIGVNQRALAGPGSTPLLINGVQNNTEHVEFEFYFPGGLWAGPNSDGSFDSWAVMLQIEYQLVGEPGWNTIYVPGVVNPVGVIPYWLAVVKDYRFDNGTEIVIDSSNDPSAHYQGQTFQTNVLADPVDTNSVSLPPVTIQVTGTWKINPNHVDAPQVATGTNYNSVAQWTSVAASFEGNQGQTPERYVFSAALPQKGQYNYRITKLGSNQHAGMPAQLFSTGSDVQLFETFSRRGEQTWLAEIREITYETFTFPNHILLDVRVCATNQLSGGNLQISAIVEMDNPETQGFTHAVRWDLPDAYYRLSDQTGKDEMGGPAAALARNTQNSAGLVNASPALSTNIVSVAPGGPYGVATNFSATGNFGFELLFLSPLSGVLCSDSGSGFECGVLGDGRMYVKNSSMTLTGTKVIQGGVIHHVAFINNVDQGTATLMCDGVIHAQHIPGFVGVTNLNFLGTNFGGTVSDIALYSSTVPIPSRMRKHYLDSLSPHNVLESYPANIQPIVNFDAVTNSLYGGGLSPSIVDIDWYKSWADRCMEDVPDGAGGFIQRFEYNGLLDQVATLWDTLTNVAHTGGAGMMKSGFLYTGVLDAPGIPVRQFNMSNIIKGSFTETWSNADNRANAVDVVYYDELNQYQRTVLTVMDLAKINAGAKILKAAQVDLRGVTNIARAWHYGNFIIKSSQQLLRSLVFSAPIDSITAWPGEVALIQHDLPEWGQGGKLMAGNTATVVRVDQDLPFDTDITYLMLFCLKLVPLLEGIHVTNVVGQIVYFTGTLDNTTAASRFVFDKYDREIMECGSHWVKLDDVSGISNVTVAAIYAQNMLIQREVGAYNNRVVTLNGALPVAPDEFDSYTFGSLGTGQPVPFHISSVKRKKGLDAEISFLEYQDSVYTDDIPQISVVQVPPDTAAIVTGLLISENYAPNGEDPTISISWKNGTATFGSIVYISRNGGKPVLLRDTQGQSADTTAFTGDTITVRVVGYDAQKISSGYNNAPTATLIVGGLNNNPSNVSGFGIGVWDDLKSTMTLAWNKNAEANIAYYSLSYFTSPAAIPNQAQCDANEIARPTGTEITLAGASYRGKGTYTLRAINTKGYASITPSAIHAFNLDDVIDGNTSKPRHPGNTPTVTIPPTPFQLIATPGGGGYALFSPFIMQTGDQNILILTVQYTLTGLTQGQGYFFYYDDPNWLGGDVTIHATQDPAVLRDPSAQGGRFIINQTPAIVPTLASTVFRPTAYSVTGPIGPSNPAFAWDGNAGTAARTTYSPVLDDFGNVVDALSAILAYTTFQPALTYLPPSLFLKIKYALDGQLLEPEPRITVSKIHAKFYGEAAQGVFSANSFTTVLFEMDGLAGISFAVHPKSFLPGFPDNSANIGHPFIHVGVDTSGAWDGTRTTCQGNGFICWEPSLNGWQMILTGHFNIGAAGKLDFMPFIESGWVLGIGGGATADAWDRNLFAGVTNTPLKGFPVLVGNQDPGNGYSWPNDANDPFYINFPTAGQYPFELCYAGGDHDISECMLTANGKQAIPIESPTFVSQASLDYSLDGGVTWITFVSSRSPIDLVEVHIPLSTAQDINKVQVRFTPVAQAFAGQVSQLSWEIVDVWLEVG